jgi:hypothetical protein
VGGKPCIACFMSCSSASAMSIVEAKISAMSNITFFITGNIITPPLFITWRVLLLSMESYINAEDRLTDFMKKPNKSLSF